MTRNKLRQLKKRCTVSGRKRYRAKLEGPSTAKRMRFSAGDDNKQSFFASEDVLEEERDDFPTNCDSD